MNHDTIVKRYAAGFSLREVAGQCRCSHEGARKVVLRKQPNLIRSPKNRVIRMKRDQELFGIVPQPRYVCPEARELHDAVVVLRKKGLSVYRAGRDTHLIDGKRVTTAQLLARAGLFARATT